MPLLTGLAGFFVAMVTLMWEKLCLKIFKHLHCVPDEPMCEGGVEELTYKVINY